MEGKRNKLKKFIQTRWEEGYLIAEIAKEVGLPPKKVGQILIEPRIIFNPKKKNAMVSTSIR